MKIPSGPPHKKSMGDVIHLKNDEQSRHVLVPKHEVISGEEKKALLESLNIDESHLPKIFVTDPAIIGLGANPGDIVRTTRKSDLIEESVYYRLVIEK